MMRTWRTCYLAFAIAFAVCFHAKASAYKSYYDILGVKKMATAKEIKCAYRLTEFHSHFKNVDNNDNNSSNNNVNTTTQETSGQIPSRQKS